MLKEWLLLAAIPALVVTSIYLKRPPACSMADAEILFILLVLFIAVKGLEGSGLIAWLSHRIDRGRFLPLKLVCATFLLSAIVTNDVALIVIVPLTLASDTNRKDILVIFEALAANAGSALTPFGNPQNLFIYWFYEIPPGTFVRCIAPFALFFLVVFALMSLFVTASNGGETEEPFSEVRRTACIHGALLLVIILTILHALPVLTGVLAILYAVFFDRDSLRIDYALLATLFCFLGISENVKCIVASDLSRVRHVFLVSALTSQVISNVPAALLFAKFTPNWKALLWGVNVGGFGSLVGSLANLIAYKLYTSHEKTSDTAAFTVKFSIFGFAAFFLGIALYFYLKNSL